MSLNKTVHGPNHIGMYMETAYQQGYVSGGVGFLDNIALRLPVGPILVQCCQANWPNTAKSLTTLQ